jgi:hypothetical protein
MLKYLRIAMSALSLTVCVLLIPLGIGTTELAIIAIVAILLFFDWPQIPPIGGAKAPK